MKVRTAFISIMRRAIIRRTALPLVLAALVGACSALTPAPARMSNAKVRVVAGANPWGDLARQLGGTHVVVRSLLNQPSADPHLFQSNARESAAVADAQVVIENGLGYDDFMRRLVSTTSAKGRVVINAAAVLQRSGDEVNPHLWYDLDGVVTVARAITAALVGVDPANRPAYDANLATLLGQLDAVRGDVARLRAAHAGAAVATTEPVADYVLRDAGLDLRSPAGFVRAVAEANEPSPADAQVMTRLLDRGEVGALVYNAQTTSRVTDAVRQRANRDGVPVVSVTELIPPGVASYQVWMRGQIDALQRALDGRR